jgi:hypothetical protein
MVACEIMSSLKERLESRKISRDEFNIFGGVACMNIKRNYSAKELMEHTTIFEVSTGIFTGLRPRSAPVRLLRLWVRIPPGE